MTNLVKNLFQQLDGNLYEEISEIEASNLKGGAIANELLSHELTHVVQQVEAEAGSGQATGKRAHKPIWFVQE